VAQGKQKGVTRRRLDPVVGHSFQICLLHSLKFQTAKAAVEIRTARTRLPLKCQRG
jgi:hypothetical protein